MIITRTPARISFFGGGSDYPAYFEKHGGAVLSTTIDKYTYISARWLPPFFEHKHRIVWSQIENVSHISEIRNNSARECLKFLNIEKGVAINHDGDLPARSGMGSSSAFTVGLLNALYHLTGTPVTPEKLAYTAIYVEQELIKDNVGNQDQVACAVGGLNMIKFYSDHKFDVESIDVTTERKQELESHLMLAFTGLPRTASEIAGTYKFDSSIRDMVECVKEAEYILCSNMPIKEFGLLMGKAWALKKRMSDSISTPYIDFLYGNSLKAGAIGGKVLGAGGGGFMLLFAEPEAQKKIKEKLKGLLWVPFKLESRGTEVILNNGND